MWNSRFGRAEAAATGVAGWSQSCRAARCTHVAKRKLARQFYCVITYSTARAGAKALMHVFTFNAHDYVEVKIFDQA